MKRTLLAVALTAVAVVACRSSGDVLQVNGTVEIREVQLAPLAAGRGSTRVPRGIAGTGGPTDAAIPMPCHGMRGLFGPVAVPNW